MLSWENNVVKKTIIVEAVDTLVTEIYDVDTTTGTETLIRKIHKNGEYERDEQYFEGKVLKVCMTYTTPEGATIIEAPDS